MSLRQISLSTWLKDGEGKTLTYAYPYFYLDWPVEETHPRLCGWYEDLTDKTVVWKKMLRVGTRDICLCSSTEPPEMPTIGMMSGSVYDSYLKSHLQKAVRRKNKRASIFTGDLLLEMSPLQLMRRLLIIMLEDSFPHHDISVVIWFMCAYSTTRINTKIFYLHERQKEWILGFIYHLTATNYKEVIPRKYYQKEDESHDFWKLLPQIHSLEKPIRDFIYSIEARVQFGGMKGDNRLLIATIHYYLDRFTNDGDDGEHIWSTEFYRPIRPILCRQTKFNQNEWIYLAYDFHCSPNILTRLEEEFPEYDKDTFKATIWHCSSSINNHQELIWSNGIYRIVKNDRPSKELTDLWKKIRKFVRGKGWGYTMRMLENLNLLYPEWVPYEPLPEKTETQDEDESEQGDVQQSQDLGSEVHLVT